METTSDSSENNPIPKKRTVPAGHRMRPLSSEESPVISSPSLTPTKRQHRREKPVRRLEGDSTQRQKPRLPKPKPRRVPPAQSASTTIPTTLPARTKYQEKEETPPPTSPPKSVPKTKKRPPKQTTTAETTGIEPVLETASGKGDGVNELRIRDILHAFQDDVVTVKSSQRNKWQEKLDAIQSQLLFPELDHRKFETVSGGDGGSVPSNWKSAASLIPRDPTPGGGRDDSRTRDQDFAIFKWFRGIQYLSSFSSGIVSGLLLWKALFAVSQMISGHGFILSPFFWIPFWTLTSVLLLVTVLGFLNRIGAEDFSLLTSLLRFLPCMIIFGSYYLSKAFDLQREECGKYLKVRKEDLRHVHPTYTCNDFVAGKAWGNLNYWKIGLDILPAFGSIIIYTILHFRSQSINSSGSEPHPIPTHRNYSEYP